MNKKILILAVILLLPNILVAAHQKEEDLQELFGKFTAWKHAHKKNYHTSEEEFYRFRVWTETKKYIETNANEEYTMKLNKFSDLTLEEFKETYLMKHVPIPEEQIGTEHVMTHDAPAEVNWVTSKKAAPVKNQGMCGSCWAFGAMCQLNAAVNIKSGTLGDFSEQQLVSCSASYGNGGCGGGWPLSGLKYVKDKGVCSNSLYPYKSGTTRDNGTCNTAKETSCKAKSPAISGLVNVPKGNCNALVDAVAKGPVVVAVDASTFGNYDGGIFGNCSTQINHAVTVVGYKQNSHWLVENSWGADWGEDGFMRIKWGNTCAICNYGQYATV